MVSMKSVVMMIISAEAGASVSAFVPACMAEQCSAEFLAVGEDNYVSSLATCAVDNFGPCASRFWDCLGDEECRAAISCAPRVFDTCKADIWKLMTDEKERKMIMCIEQCPLGKDGKPSTACVLEKCGKAAVDCLLDSTCRHVVNCVPQAMQSCSASAFKCIFSSDGVCRDNVKCLASGVAQCSAPGVNILTDTKIADLITCAGSKCPHPVTGAAGHALTASTSEASFFTAPVDASGELLCMAAKCPSSLPKILLDQDSKDLLTCAAKTNFSSIWDCLGESGCQKALTCWSKPLETCKQDVWHLLTDAPQRTRIEKAAKCLHTCEQKHHDDFVAASFCVLDDCSQSLLDCYHDDLCSSALKCLPATALQCSIPTLEAYTTDSLFQNAVKGLAFGLEACGRAAVEMLRDQNIAEGIRCAAQCTRKPNATSSEMIVV